MRLKDLISETEILEAMRHIDDGSPWNPEEAAAKQYAVIRKDYANAIMVFRAMTANMGEDIDTGMILMLALLNQVIERRTPQ
jgi:hypothetical protein